MSRVMVKESCRKITMEQARQFRLEQREGCFRKYISQGENELDVVYLFNQIEKEFKVLI